MPLIFARGRKNICGTDNLVIFVNVFQVKYIILRDIPSCSMQGLSQCPDVRSLTLHNCGLLAVEGLDKCKELQELHVKVNCLQ